MRNKGLLFLGIIALTGSLGLSAKPAGPTLKKMTEFDLPGPPGKRFDYLTITPDDHYLLSTHLAAGQMYVIDLRTNNIVKTLHFDSEAGMPQYDPVAQKVYVNLQDKNIFAVIDPATDEVVGRYPVGRCEGNHGMTLDPEHHRAFLSCEGNELMTVF